MKAGEDFPADLLNWESVFYGLNSNCRMPVARASDISRDISSRKKLFASLLLLEGFHQSESVETGTYPLLLTTSVHPGSILLIAGVFQIHKTQLMFAISCGESYQNQTSPGAARTPTITMAYSPKVTPSREPPVDPCRRVGPDLPRQHRRSWQL